MKFCSNCGNSVAWIIPEGDNRPRHVCNNPLCGSIHYDNPRIITGSIPTHGDQVLLCKRAIEPRYGLWTLPAGFLENGETTEEGAKRESWEEAKAKLNVEQLYTLFELPHINQVYFFYKASLTDMMFGAGAESLEVKLFSEKEIPWDQIAFPAVFATLKYFFNDLKRENFQFRSHILDNTENKEIGNPK